MPGVVVGGSLDHPDQQGKLIRFQFGQIAAEIEPTGHGKTMDSPLSILTQVDLVQVGFKNFIFTVVVLQQQSHYGLVYLTKQGLFTAEKYILYQLLGEGAATLHGPARPKIS